MYPPLTSPNTASPYTAPPPPPPPPYLGNDDEVGVLVGQVGQAGVLRGEAAWNGNKGGGREKGGVGNLDMIKLPLSVSVSLSPSLHKPYYSQADATLTTSITLPLYLDRLTLPPSAVGAVRP